MTNKLGYLKKIVHLRKPYELKNSDKYKFMRVLLFINTKCLNTLIFFISESSDVEGSSVENKGALNSEELTRILILVCLDLSKISCENLDQILENLVWPALQQESELTESGKDYFLQSLQVRIKLLGDNFGFLDKDIKTVLNQTNF